MNSVSLLTSLTLARGDQWQEDVALQPLGAEFAAIMAPLDTPAPVPNPKQPLAKVPDVNDLIAQAGIITAEGEAALPFFWQAIVSDLVGLPPISADLSKGQPPEPDDGVPIDAAMAYCLTPPAVLPLDLNASADVRREGDIIAAQSVFAPTDQPTPDRLGGLVLPQVAANGVLPDRAPAPPDKPDTEPTVLATTPENPPLGLDSPQAIFDAAQLTAAARLDPTSRTQGRQGERIMEKNSGQGGVVEGTDQPRSPDFDGASPVRMVQVSSAGTQGAGPRLEVFSPAAPQAAESGTVGQALAAQAQNAGTKGVVQGLEEGRGGATRGEDLAAKVDGWIGLKGEVVTTADVQQTKPDKRDQAPLAAPIAGLQNAPPLPPPQALTEPKPGRVIARDPALRLEVKRSSGVHPSAESAKHPSAEPAVLLQPAVQPSDTRPAQPDLPLRPAQPPSEAPPKGERGATDVVIALTAAPEAASGGALLPSGSGMVVASPLPVSTPLAQPNPLPTLQANMPALIAHLHHPTPREGHSHAEVSMNPAELGRIRFEMITQGDQVQVTLSVERPETLDLLRTNAEALRQEFREAGLNADTLTFGQWAQRAPPRDQAEAPPEPAASAAPPLAIPTPYVKPVSTSGLDLRL